MTTDTTELAQSLKAGGISPERMEWLKKLADMKYCASNPGHWLMSLKETNYLAVVALQCLEKNLALVEAQQRIAKLESRTVNVKLPTTIEPTAFSPWVAKAFYQFHKDTVKSCFAVFSDACAAAGIKVEAE